MYKKGEGCKTPHRTPDCSNPQNGNDPQVGLQMIPYRKLSWMWNANDPAGKQDNVNATMTVHSGDNGSMKATSYCDFILRQAKNKCNAAHLCTIQMQELFSLNKF